MFQLSVGSRSVTSKVCYRVLTHAKHAQAIRTDYPSAEHGFLVSNANNRAPVCKQRRRQGVWQADLGGFDVSWQLHKRKAAA